MRWGTPHARPSPGAFGLYWGVVIALYLYFTERSASRPAGAAAPGWWGRTAEPVRIAGMFAVASIGWIFFRADSMSTAWQILGNLFSVEGQHTVLRPDVPDAPPLWALIGGLLVAEWLYRNRPGLRASLQGGQVAGTAARYALLGAISFSYLISQGGAGQPFIYFQF